MKKAILSAIVLLASVSTFAAASGNLTISGTIALINDITITPNLANNTSLNILGGETSKNVASVSETSNSVTGYQISLRSANGGTLNNLSNPLFKTAYKVSYDNSAMTSLTTVDQVLKSASTNSLVTDSSAVNVEVTAAPTAPAGTYQDVITISISSI